MRRWIPPFQTGTPEDIHHLNAYPLRATQLAEARHWTLGVSADLFDSRSGGS